MAIKRITVVYIVIAVALVGAGAYTLTSGEQPIIKLEESSNTVKVEAGGIGYNGWPEMAISVNGEQVVTIPIDKQMRDMYSAEVPNRLAPIKTIEVKIANQSYCQNLGVPCERRKIVFRKLFLNDKQLEGGVPSGERNTANLLETSDGGITFEVAQ